MGLLFKETIFLKETSDLETELVDLEELKGKVKDQDKLDRIIKKMQAAEWDVVRNEIVHYILPQAR